MGITAIFGGTFNPPHIGHYEMLRSLENNTDIEEIMLLPEGAKMMTIECGMRFLADFIDGDKYFKTAYPEHNLDRCRTQLKLVSEMEKHWDEMKSCVSEYVSSKK